MGFYLRKSLSVGPFRFNLSKSGIGVSAGVRGLRFGMGPRGNYVHMGRYGLYYRQTLPSIDSSSRPDPTLEPGRQPQIPANTHDPLTEIESADVAQMVDSSSANLLAELKEKRIKIRLWPVVTGAGVILLACAHTADWPSWSIGLITMVSAVVIFIAVKRDQLVKTVVLFYDFDEEMEKAYQLIHDSAATLATSARIWHIDASGRVRDRKYHAGADHLIRRKPTAIRTAEPPYVKTNISTIALGVGRQTLHFFPDRLLIYDSHDVGAIAYPSLHLETRNTRFVEDSTVPHDAQVVDHTWQYVNKNGGPDKRFKNNRQLPVCLYAELSLQSSSGLNEVIQISKAGVAEGFIDAVDGLASLLQQVQGRTS